MDTVNWNDEVLAEALIDKCASMNVKIHPETALQMAKEIRDNCAEMDIISVSTAVRDAVSNLLSTGEDSKMVNSSLDKMLAKIAEVTKKFSAEEDDIQARAAVYGIVLPAQDAIKEATKNKIKQKLDEMDRLEKETDQIYAQLENPSDLNRLKREADAAFAEAQRINRDANASYSEKNEASRESRAKNEEYRQELNRRKYLKYEYNRKKTRANSVKAYIILLDKGLKIVDQNLYSPGSWDKSGWSDYIKDVIGPWVSKTKSFYADLRKGILVEDASIDPVTKKPTDKIHEFGWLTRPTTTTRMQESDMDPNQMDITIDDVKQSPVYEALVKRGLSDSDIEAMLEYVNERPNTWEKGKLIFALLDPPSEEHTVKTLLNTLMKEDRPKDQKGRHRSREFTRMQPKGESLDDFLDRVEEAAIGIAMEDAKTRNRQYWSDERKEDEALDPNLHWSILFALSKESLHDEYGRIAADSYIQELPEELQDMIGKDDSELTDDQKEIKKKIIKKAEKYAEELMLNTDGTIKNIIENEGTPAWVLMKMVLSSQKEEFKKLALNKLAERGIHPVSDGEGDWKRDDQNNIIFTFGEKKRPSIKREAQMNSGTAQISNIQTQIDNNESQIEQLNNQINQIRQRNEGLKNNMDSLREEQGRAQEQKQNQINNMQQGNPVQPTQPLATAKFKVTYKKRHG